jgi:hypothetical protein
VDEDHRTLTVEGKRFALPTADSALVVMVNVAPNGLPRAVTTSAIPAEALPDEYWGKHWQSGDTSFFVHPDFDKQMSMLRTALARSPAVAAFLETGPLLTVARSGSTSQDALVQAQRPARESASLFAFHPDLPAVDGPFECAGSERIGESGFGRTLFGAQAISISAAFPSRAETRATVVVIVDSAGKILRYAERRGPPIKPAAGSAATPAQVAAAAAAARATTITLDYRQGTGIAENRGGGGPDEIVFGPVELVDSMDKFGKAAERAARVLAQCKEKR